MPGKFFAHSLDGKPKAFWQPMEDHLTNVAKMARASAEAFNAGEWGYLAGMWHDIGKYSDDFQRKIGALDGENARAETKSVHVDHSTAGARHAVNLLQNKGRLLAYALAGHHAGLPDGKDSSRQCLHNRLKKTIPSYANCPDHILNSDGADGLGDLPFTPCKPRLGFQLSFFIRMIFSCLVDGDFLDTEHFMNKEQSRWREGYPGLGELNEKLTSQLERMCDNAKKTFLNRRRAEILQNCLDFADKDPGLFSLTVPTGGGKTLSSLAFALKHAIKNGMSRVIYVIPYTSIIEQNAAVFRDKLGDDAVLEHHSNFEPDKEDHRSRLAAENWDAPVVVTTNVQFFESLFSRKTSRCRKIHHISNSVVILDEAQMLPPDLLKPSLEALKELAGAYRTTIVLCTATQPALTAVENFKGAEIPEIVDDPGQLYEDLKRVNTTVLGPLDDEDLADRLASHERALCIVNTRNHAKRIFELMTEDGDPDGCFHLSALMCPAHRTAKFKEIRHALQKGEPCLVVSTQLIEAGVDIDFPVVFRASAGIDSIAQAAGRCNREGNLLEKGRLYVFTPEAGLPPGYFRQTAQAAETVIRHCDDPLSLDAVEEYFTELYWARGDQTLDKHQILESLEEGVGALDFPFKYVAEKYKIIEQNTESVIIPWNEKARRIIHDIRHAEHASRLSRKAQRFTVQVRISPKDMETHETYGNIEHIHNQFRVLTNMDIYDDDLGLCLDDPTFRNPESLMA